MASILNVDQINNAAGTSAVTIDPSTGKPSFPNGAVLPAGSVVQVQSSSKLSTQTGVGSIAVSASSTYISTDNEVSITPKFANSKIIVQVHGGSFFAATPDTRGYVTIFRFVSGQANVDLANGAGFGLTNHYNDSANHMSPTMCGAVDSSLVDTVTPHIYKLYMARNGPSGTIYFGYDPSNVYMTAMEIAQ